MKLNTNYCYSRQKICFKNTNGGLLLEKGENENEFIAHRIQIKLGVSSIKYDESKEIKNKVDSQLENFEKCFIGAGKKISKCVNYLVTTRGIELPAKEFFEKYSWEIFGQKELAQIWPDSIKALRKPFKTF
jgi:hypothetical protein